MRHPLPFAPRRGRVQAKRSTQGMHENHRNNLSLNNDSLSRSAGAVRNIPAKAGIHGAIRWNWKHLLIPPLIPPSTSRIDC